MGTGEQIPNPGEEDKCEVVPNPEARCQEIHEALEQAAAWLDTAKARFNQWQGAAKTKLVKQRQAAGKPVKPPKFPGRRPTSNKRP